MTIGYGGQEIPEDLLVVGEDWWLERHEYDGAEWFEYKTMIKKPTKELELFSITRKQVIERAETFGVWEIYPWATLKNFNKTEKEILEESD